MAKRASRSVARIDDALSELRQHVDDALSELRQHVDGLQQNIERTTDHTNRLQVGFEKQSDDLLEAFDRVQSADVAVERATAERTTLRRELSLRLDALELAVRNMTARLAGAGRGAETGGHAPPALPGDTSAADTDPDHAAFLDRFYRAFEDRHRGSEEKIMRRLRVYLPVVKEASARTGGRPALDLGCGRGEWLTLLREAGITATGVDSNPEQIADAIERGLDIRLGDVLAALDEAEDGSLSVITAHHVVEHLPFDLVVRLVRRAFRALAPGGVLIVETPNTSNVLVGATTFFTDPTHLKPMPEHILGVLFETAGYAPVRLMHLNPHERLEDALARPGFDAEVAHLLYGPQDLGVVGTKPEPMDAPFDVALGGGPLDGNPVDGNPVDRGSPDRGGGA
ncbi:methyltransferase domain-containing protein [Rhodovulum sp. 12E13]|nr:methyltransferase domain-containing protein [Rhodovulum sp. 12E13]